MWTELSAIFLVWTDSIAFMEVDCATCGGSFGIVLAVVLPASEFFVMRKSTLL